MNKEQIIEAIKAMSSTTWSKHAKKNSAFPQQPLWQPRALPLRQKPKK